MTTVPIRIKRLSDAAVVPQYAHSGDSGFDLVATQDVIVEPGETVKVPTGLAFEIPEGYELQIRPRSGITSKTKLRVQLGTVDASYRGEVSVIVDNVAETSYSLKADIPDDELVFELIPGTAFGHRMELGDNGHWTVVYGNFLSLTDNPLFFHENNDPVDPFGPKYKQGAYLIRTGDRIAQAVIAPVVQASFAVVDELTESDRGNGGFGSTGVSV